MKPFCMHTPPTARIALHMCAIWVVQRTGRACPSTIRPDQEITPLPGIYFFDGWRVHPTLVSQPTYQAQKRHQYVELKAAHTVLLAQNHPDHRKKFTDKNAPGLSLTLDKEFQAADCFSELARGYTQGVVDPYKMMGLQPTGPTRVNLEIIVPSGKGLTPEMWKQTATLCPLDWPSNYNLLRLWHTPKSFHQYAAQLKQQVQHQHMFTIGKSIALS